MSGIIPLDLLDPFFQFSLASGGQWGKQKYRNNRDIILLEVNRYIIKQAKHECSNFICPAVTSLLYPLQNSSVAPTKTAGSFQPPTLIPHIKSTVNSNRDGPSALQVSAAVLWNGYFFYTVTSWR